MLASTFLDTAIGIIFVFLLLSIIATTINEIIQSFLNMRGRTLLEGIKTLLNNDPKLVSCIYNHGQIYGLFRGEFNPSKSWKERVKGWKAQLRKLENGSSGNARTANGSTVSPPSADPATDPSAVPPATQSTTQWPAPPATRRNLPSYIPSANFASALLGVLVAEAKANLAEQAKAGNPGQGATAALEAQSNFHSAKQAAADLANAAKKANDEVYKVVSNLITTQAERDDARRRAQDAQAAATDAATAVDLASNLVVYQLVRFAANNIDHKIGKPLLGILETANNDIDKLKAGVENWYNSAMDRISGWYKYNTQWVLFWIGCVLAVALNADTINIVKQISTNDTLRQSIVAAAQKAKNPADSSKDQQPTPAASGQPAAASPAGDELKNEFQQVGKEVSDVKGLGLPLGWGTDTFPRGWWPVYCAEGWFLHCYRAEAARVEAAEAQKLAAKAQTTGNLTHAAAVVVEETNVLGWSALGGWLLTAIAVSLGAPFWFDLLNKFMIVRSTVKPQEKSKEEGSKDKAPTT